MIEDAVALAARVAPCITDPDFAFAAAAKAVIRGAILRWNDAGSGALNTEQLEDYSYSTDTRQPRRGLFWPSEISQLQDMCRTGGPAGAFSLDTVADGERARGHLRAELRGPVLLLRCGPHPGPAAVRERSLPVDCPATSSLRGADGHPGDARRRHAQGCR
jgi:hypothetical protein